MALYLIQIHATLFTLVDFELTWFVFTLPLVVMLDGWSEVVEDYILAENIIRIGTIHAAVPYTDTHKEEREREEKKEIPIWNVTKNL